MKVNVLIDSHGWIEYFAEGPLAAKYAKYIENASASEYVTPSIILYEVYKRMKSSNGEDAAIKAIAYIIGHTAIIPVDMKISVAAAEISLKAKLAMADAILKAVADEHGAKIVTGDQHFRGMQNVIFVE